MIFVNVLARIADEKIREAILNGEFDNLSGKGEPLKLEDLSRVPEELRAAYTILKNAGMLPEELQLKKEVLTLQQLLNCCYDDEERRTLTRKLNEKVLRFNLLMEKRKVGAASLWGYREKIYRRLLAARPLR